MEGRQIYVDSDSLLIYNRIDHYAEKVPLHESRLTTIGAIASVNILELLNYTEDPQNVASTYQSEDYFVLLMKKDRKSTRLNSSHVAISYAVFCLKKKNNTKDRNIRYFSYRI